MPEPNPTAGPFAYEGLDRVLHEKARLGILMALVTQRRGLPFNDLKRLCSLTDGNLSRHLSVLEEAGIIVVHKAFEGKRPLTTCALTSPGRRRFRAYLALLERVLRDAEPSKLSAEPSMGLSSI